MTIVNGWRGEDTETEVRNGIVSKNALGGLNFEEEGHIHVAVCLHICLIAAFLNLDAALYTGEIGSNEMAAPGMSRFPCSHNSKLHSNQFLIVLQPFVYSLNS